MVVVGGRRGGWNAEWRGQSNPETEGVRGWPPLPPPGRLIREQQGRSQGEFFIADPRPSLLQENASIAVISQLQITLEKA